MATIEIPTVREAAPSDADVILRLIDALADYEKLSRPDAAGRERLVQDLFGPNPRIRCALAFVGGTAAGYALLFDTYSSFLAKPKLYLEDLFVAEQWRGAGVGHALFSYALKEAKRLGYAKLQWQVLDWNEPAIRFYKRQGAKSVGGWHAYELDTAEDSA